MTVDELKDVMQHEFDLVREDLHSLMTDKKDAHAEFRAELDKFRDDMTGLKVRDGFWAGGAAVVATIIAWLRGA